MASPVEAGILAMACPAETPARPHVCAPTPADPAASLANRRCACRFRRVSCVVARALCGRARRDAELLHHAHHVEHAPVFASQTVLTEPDDVDHLDADALTGRRHTHEIAVVGAGEP